VITSPSGGTRVPTQDLVPVALRGLAAPGCTTDGEMICLGRVNMTGIGTVLCRFSRTESRRLAVDKTWSSRTRPRQTIHWCSSLALISVAADPAPTSIGSHK
jgi:hypothetical protein